jgi:hypothetical protein
MDRYRATGTFWFVGACTRVMILVRGVDVMDETHQTEVMSTIGNTRTYHRVQTDRTNDTTDTVVRCTKTFSRSFVSPPTAALTVLSRDSTAAEMYFTIRTASHDTD